MTDLSQSFEQIADFGMWETAAATTAGFLAPHIIANVVESRAGFDVPNEVYGVAVVAAGQMSPMYGAELSMGGGIYAVDSAAERIGLREAVTGMGGN
jgi:hypothetical protein